jgi:dolichol-phosphate mannosyltransferase
MNVKKLSFVIPAMNEEATLSSLYTQIAKQAEALELPFEVIFIDDGSSDQTWAVMQNMADEFPHTVRAIRMRTNVGKARALAEGFQQAQGEVVFTLDADLQDDPVEIPRFLAKLEEGYDVVSGYKQTRHDPWHKVWPSRVFNRMVSELNQVRLHDHNCGFKCYRREVVKQVRLYGEMHRMVPCLASLEGFRSAEIVVRHHPRRFGVSKYGVRRFFRGFMDMCTVHFLKFYRERPLHFCAGMAGWTGGLSLILGAAGILAARYWAPAHYATYGAAALLAAVPVLLAMGLVCELLVSGRRAAGAEAPVAEDTGKPEQESRSVSGEEVDFLENADPGVDGARPSEILLADDQLVNRAVVRMQLEDQGHTLIEAQDGVEALEKLTSRTGLVLLDLKMPRMDGLTALKRIRAERPEVPVVMISQNSETELVVQAMKAGAFDYITRPLSKDRLRHLVRVGLQTYRAQSAYQQNVVTA